MIFVRRARDDDPDTVFSSDAEEDLRSGPSPFVRLVAALLVVALFILMTDLFVSLVLSR